MNLIEYSRNGAAFVIIEFAFPNLKVIFYYKMKQVAQLFYKKGFYMKNYQTLLLLSLLLPTAPSIAKEYEPYWSILLSGGLASLDAQNSIIYLMQDAPGDELNQSNSNDWKSWTVQLGVGYAIPLFDSKEYSDELQWFPLIEPQIKAYYLQGNIDGHVDMFYQYPGDYYDTDYTTDFESTRLMFDLALTFASYRNLSVYGLAGLGPSWNRVNYHAKENICWQSVNLDAKTSTNFAYEFGGGLNYSLNEHIAITSEYLYTGFDNIQLSNEGDSGTQSLEEVSAGDFDLHSQAVFLGFRWSL